MFFLCVCLIFPCVFTYEVTTKPNNVENAKNVSDLTNNVATVPSNASNKSSDTIITQRITQPLQTQKIERISETYTPLRNGSLKLENKTDNFENFKPSPQLETYYEYNKFPVVPVLPEAKTFGGFTNPGYSSNSWEEKPSLPVAWSNNQGFQNSWFESPKKFNTNPTTTAQPWFTRVKFPSPAVNENPYTFVGNEGGLKSYHPPVSFATTTEGFAFNKPVDTSTRNFNKPSPGLWQKLMGSVSNVDKNAVAVQKTFLDYNLMEKPSHYNTPVKEHDTGISSYGSSSSLKKIIKLLTAIIPIGLFISALTPTVITVTSVNDTQSSSRYRIDNPKHKAIASRLVSSLKYAEQIRSCEDKILCELLVTASVSKNSEEHIQNLLDTFSEHEDLHSQKEDLLKVFEAVKKEDCRSVVCKSKKNPS
ncbi:uncharacterized protein LOC111691716 [Anoplophora glabripennis]|uniref:uncharacterized protein LOC111691716 n=1 Tax=Anoplophora glabripennis TaxID=217634 RepID=UPI000C779B6F|nr:uncharacterized protein LOC111691716 [Anoplophora glabripennis]